MTPSPPVTPSPPAASRRPLLLILLLFAAPLAFAFWLYYGSTWRPTLRTNHGELIEPVVELPALTLPLATGDRASPRLLTGKWSLVVIGAGDTGPTDAGCGADCREALVYARQTWLSLGKLVPRVQRVLLAGPACCDLGYLQREHNGLAVVQAGGPDAGPLLHAFPPPFARTIFIVDPLGNLMMRYDVHQDPKGLREDLQKLLELSHIG